MNATAKKPFKPIEISDTGLELIEYLSLDCTAAQGEWYSDSEIKIDKNGFVIRNGEKTKDFWDGTIRSEGKPLRLKIRNFCGDELCGRFKMGFDFTVAITPSLQNIDRELQYVKSALLYADKVTLISPVVYLYTQLSTRETD